MAGMFLDAPDMVFFEIAMANVRDYAIVAMMPIGETCSSSVIKFGLSSEVIIFVQFYIFLGN